MTATNHTENYNLSQFVGTDHPTWLGDYNGDMEKIDAQMKANADAIEQAAAGGLTSVSHTTDLTGNGTSGSPLGVADTIARKTDIPDTSGFATTESVRQAIASAIADRLTAGDIKPGNGINIETSGNQVTISYVGGGAAGGLTAVAHDDTLTGDGTADNGLSVIGSIKNATRCVTIDPNVYTKAGVYYIAANRDETVLKNIPPELHDIFIRASLVVCKCGDGTDDLVQLWLNRSGNNGEPFVSYRISINNTWRSWQRIAFASDIPDVSALTSRIDTLESQVTALTTAATPSTTGLTATQLDTQYSDDYNIVRVGTPTRNMETEESSQ